MKSINKMLIGLFIFSISFMVLLFISLSKISNEIDKELIDIKSNLGKNVIIKNDTLMVMDFSILKDSYIL